eukprot:NODE_904_length_1835_cov_33.723964_g797_i0.p1 GENE.NODE_904_length_1835_cov_33.723964_g797_i0~~NODE_904_length_1835_cov_33.723964_g797_i0.p1  ORF type:complete len:258 (-),score=30.65 NODE_904_length_1835_cov_33.723964_g797_i0:972-1745(-)
MALSDRQSKRELLLRAQTMRNQISNLSQALGSETVHPSEKPERAAKKHRSSESQCRVKLLGASKPASKVRAEACASLVPELEMVDNRAVERPQRCRKPSRSIYSMYHLPEDLNRCKSIILQIRQHNHAQPFNKPVDPDALGIPHYRKIITSPMDLETIHGKIERGEYESAADVIRDTQLVWDNCRTFNGDDHIFSLWASELESLYGERLREVAEKYSLEGTGAAAFRTFQDWSRESWSAAQSDTSAKSRICASSLIE